MIKKASMRRLIHLGHQLLLRRTNMPSLSVYRSSSLPQTRMRQLNTGCALWYALAYILYSNAVIPRFDSMPETVMVFRTFRGHRKAHYVLNRIN